MVEHKVIDDSEADFEAAYLEHYRKVQEQHDAEAIKDIKFEPLNVEPGELELWRNYLDEYLSLTHLMQLHALPTNIFGKPLALEE